MICPVQLISEMSAFQVARGKAHVGGGHEALQRGGRGADDENPRSDVASGGEKDHLGAGGGDYRHHGPPDATLAWAVPEVWLRRSFRSAQGQAEPSACPAGDRGESPGFVPREVFGFERAPLSREAR